MCRYDTGLLPTMMTFQGDATEDPSFQRPPTGSFDDDEEFEIPMINRAAR